MSRKQGSTGDDDEIRAASTTSAHPEQPASDARPDNRPVVAIIGGGAAGLAAAQALMRGGARAIVFEARARVGGRVLTTRLTPDANLPFAELAYRGPPPRSKVSPSAETIELEAAAIPPPEPVPFVPVATRHVPTLSAVRTSGRLKKKIGVDEVDSDMPAPVESAAQEKIIEATLSFTHVKRKARRAAPVSDDRTENVDIGASIMHGCGDDIQFVLKRAIREKIRAPIVAGGLVYESTSAAAWYDEDGQRIPTREIIEMHRVYSLVVRYVGADATYTDDTTLGMRGSWDFGVEHVERHRGRPFSKRERIILEKIAARGNGYCAPMRDMSLHQAAINVNEQTINYQIGMPYDEDDPPLPGELVLLVPGEIASDARLMDKWLTANEAPATPVVSMRGGTGDRIVLDGYTPFLIDKLAVGVDVRLETIVKRISVVKPMAPLEKAQRSGPWCVGYSSSKKAAKNNAQRLASGKGAVVQIETAAGEKFEFDYAIVTLPLGVLQGKHEKSKVEFSPSLSENKQLAIRGLGMGVHNKVVLRFREEDVFWPRNTPQLNCLDLRFQFFNLHAYGKPGVLLVHIFAESGFASGFNGLSDTEVVDEVVDVLHKTFCGTGKWMKKVQRSDIRPKSRSRSGSRSGGHRSARKSPARASPKRAFKTVGASTTPPIILERSPQNGISGGASLSLSASTSNRPIYFRKRSLKQSKSLTEGRTKRTDFMPQRVLPTRGEHGTVTGLDAESTMKVMDLCEDSKSKGLRPVAAQKQLISEEEEVLDSSDRAQPPKSTSKAKRRKTKHDTNSTTTKVGAILKVEPSRPVTQGAADGSPILESCQSPNGIDINGVEGSTRPTPMVRGLKVTEAIIEGGCGLGVSPSITPPNGAMKVGQVRNDNIRKLSLKSVTSGPLTTQSVPKIRGTKEGIVNGSNFGPSSSKNVSPNKSSRRSCVDEEILDGSAKVPRKRSRLTAEEEAFIVGSDIHAVRAQTVQEHETVLDGSDFNRAALNAHSPSKKEIPTSHELVLSSQGTSKKMARPTKVDRMGLEVEEILDSSDIPAPMAMHRGATRTNVRKRGSDVKVDEEILDGSGIVANGSKTENKSHLNLADDSPQGSTTNAVGERSPDIAEKSIASKLVGLNTEEESNQTSTDNGENDKASFDPGCPLPRPVHYVVTRWDADPFSLGSYSYVPIGGDFGMIEEFKVPERMGTDKPILFFAGEHASDLGWQCVHGAYETGLIAAHGILVNAGLVPEGSRFQDLDVDEASTQKDGTSRRPKRRKLQPSVDHLDVERIRKLCRDYTLSHGHFYDVFDEMLYQLYPEEYGSWLKDGLGTAKRKELWRQLQELALRGEEEVAAFLRMRHYLAREDADKYGIKVPFDKRQTTKKRVNNFPPERLQEHLSSLDGLLKSKRLNSKSALTEQFARSVYLATGAVLTLDCVVRFVEQQLALQEISLPDETSEEKAQSLQICEILADSDISSMLFPVCRFFYTNPATNG